MQKLGTTAYWPGVESRPDYIVCVVLAAGVAKQITVPTGAGTAKFKATSPFCAKYGDNPTATVPSSDVTDGSASDLCPSWVPVNGIAKISVVSDTSCRVHVIFYS